MFTTFFIVASPVLLQNKTFDVLACPMKQAMSVLSDNGFWLVLAMLLANFCAARELSLYRVDGNEGNVKLHRTGHSSTAGKSFTIVDDSPKDSYVKAAVGYQNDKDAKYRSEEAKLHQERRLMFLRNLQLGSMAQSLRPEDTYQIGSLSMPIGELEPTYQIGTTWNVLNSALDADRAHQVGYQIDSSRLAVPALSDLDQLEVLVERANAYAGFETKGGINDGQGGEQVDADETEGETAENTYTVQFEPPQLRGGATKTATKTTGATKSPKKTKGEKSKKMKAKTSTALKSKKGPSKEPTKVLKSTKQAKGGKKKASEKKSKKVKSTKSPKV